MFFHSSCSKTCAQALKQYSNFLVFSSMDTMLGEGRGRVTRIATQQASRQLTSCTRQALSAVGKSDVPKKLSHQKALLGLSITRRCYCLGLESNAQKREDGTD